MREHRGFVPSRAKARPTTRKPSRGPVIVLAVAACALPGGIARADLVLGPYTKTYTAASGGWGTDANWNPSGQPGTGDAVLLAPGTNDGTVTITYDQTAIAASLLQLAIDSTTTAGINLNQSDGTLTTALQVVGANGVGTVTQSGGALRINGTSSTGGGLYLGYAAGANGTYTLGGGGTLTVAGDEVIGDSGQGAFTQNAGTHASATLTVGSQAGSSGTFSLSGGTLTVAGDEVIGQHGGGTYVQFGGVNTVTNGGGFYVGRDTGVTGQGQGTVIMAGGTLTAALADVGGNAPGNFTQAGGNLALAQTLIVGDANTGSFLQSSGSTTAGALFVGTTAGRGTGSVLIQGGSLSVGSAYVGGSGTAAGGVGTVALSNGTWAVSGTLRIWNGTANAVTIAGGTMTATALVNDGQFVQTGGTASVGAVSGTGSLSVRVGTLSAASFNQSAVNIGNGGTLRVLQGSPPATNVTGGLTLTGSGTLDLANQNLLTNTSAGLVAYLTRAAGPVRSNGLNAWNGPGVTSSLVQADAATGNAKQLVVGYFDSRDNAQTGLNVPDGQTLVKETVYGDANGDGKVNIADLSVWNNNFGVASPRWSQGDFNYDGKVNIADLSVWNDNFGASLATSSAARPESAPKAVAAPAAVTLASPSAATPPPGEIEIDVDPTTGDLRLLSGGVSVAAVEVDSAAGVLIPANWKSLRLNYGYTQWAFPRGTPNAYQIAEFTSDASSGSGQPAYLPAGMVLDYGDILPNESADFLVQDLTVTFNAVVDPVLGTTQTRSAYYVLPEPTGALLTAVAVLLLLQRRRREIPPQFTPFSAHRPH